MIGLNLINTDNSTVPFATVTGGTYGEMLQAFVRAVEEEYDLRLELISEIPNPVNMEFGALRHIQLVSEGGYEVNVTATPACIY